MPMAVHSDWDSFATFIIVSRPDIEFSALVQLTSPSFGEGHHCNYILLVDVDKCHKVDEHHRNESWIFDKYYMPD
jgi:hypothetical protein